MRNQEQGRALLADLEQYCGYMHSGPGPDGHLKVVLKMMEDTTLSTAAYGQVLRWAGPDIAVNLRPGVWSVNLAALRARVIASAEPPARSGIDMMLGPIPE